MCVFSCLVGAARDSCIRVAPARAEDFMYISSGLHRGLIIVGVAVLASVGLIGWMHRSPAPAANPEPVAGYANYAQPLNDYGQPVTTNGQPNNYAQPGAYAQPANRYGYAERVAPPQPAYGQPPVAYGVAPFRYE